jgi:phenylpyruvate tautomerase PptA (4-oxalocrotonate tautomerase family)
MPFVEVKSIRGVFSTEEKVVVNELDDGNWGEGGSVLKAEDA